MGKVMLFWLLALFFWGVTLYTFVQLLMMGENEITHWVGWGGLLGMSIFCTVFASKITIAIRIRARR